jgi:flagellar secretion chaperone FliS
MPGTTAIQQYHRQSVLTAPPVKIVALLYEKVIRCLSLAEAGLADRHFDSVSRNIGQAQEIIGELLSALNYESGGTVARDLQRLYTFALENMMNANIERNSAMLAQVRRVLTTLHEAWDEISRN